jgi:hypothetical protein
MATFLRLLSHDGVSGPAWLGWGGARPPPFTLSTPSTRVIAKPGSIVLVVLDILNPMKLALLRAFIGRLEVVIFQSFGHS